MRLPSSCDGLRVGRVGPTARRSDHSGEMFATLTGLVLRSIINRRGCLHANAALIKRRADVEMAGWSSLWESGN